jgi:hypothetical protein
MTLTGMREQRVGDTDFVNGNVQTLWCSVTFNLNGCYSAPIRLRSGQA